MHPNISTERLLRTTYSLAWETHDPFHPRGSTFEVKDLDFVCNMLSRQDDHLCQNNNIMYMFSKLSISDLHIEAMNMSADHGDQFQLPLVRLTY